MDCRVAGQIRYRPERTNRSRLAVSFAACVSRIYRCLISLKAKVDGKFFALHAIDRGDDSLRRASHGYKEEFGQECGAFHAHRRGGKDERNLEAGALLLETVVTVRDACRAGEKQNGRRDRDQLHGRFMAQDIHRAARPSRFAPNCQVAPRH